jgi:hypothetical protein
MSEPDNESRSGSSGDRDIPDEEPSKGSNLVLLYSLIALALVAAIVFALMIVQPFYQRR